MIDLAERSGVPRRTIQRIEDEADGSTRRGPAVAKLLACFHTAGILSLEGGLVDIKSADGIAAAMMVHFVRLVNNPDPEVRSRVNRSLLVLEDFVRRHAGAAGS